MTVFPSSDCASRRYARTLVASDVRAADRFGKAALTQAGDGHRTSRASTGLLAIIAICVVAGLALRIACSILLPNIHRPDEIFQNLEPAFRMWSGGGVETWEWREGIRSPVFPAIIAGLMGLGSVAGLGATGTLTLIHTVFAIMSAAVIVVGCLIGWRGFGRTGALLCGMLCAVWPDLVDFGPKTLTEIQAGHLLTVALYAGVYAGRTGTTSSAKPVRRAWWMFVCGLLLGAVFVIRFQLVAGIAVAAAFACLGEQWRRWPILFAGMAVPILLSGAVDRLYWGSWFQSIWLNYAFNITQHVSDDFGVQSGLYYLSASIDVWGSALVILFVFAFVGFRHARALGLLAGAVVLSHSLIAHKEISFVYAAIPPLVILAGLGSAGVVLELRKALPRETTWPLPAMTGFWLAVAVTTASSGSFRGRWDQGAAPLRAAALIAEDADACGVALQMDAVPWYVTGGDAAIGRPVPFYPYRSSAGRARAIRAANYALTGANEDDLLPGFAIVACWPAEPGAVCLSRAPERKACVADPGFDLNTVKDLGRRTADFGPDR